MSYIISCLIFDLDTQFQNNTCESENNISGTDVEERDQSNEEESIIPTITSRSTNIRKSELQEVKVIGMLNMDNMSHLCM